MRLLLSLSFLLFFSVQLSCKPRTHENGSKASTVPNLITIHEDTTVQFVPLTVAFTRYVNGCSPKKIPPFTGSENYAFVITGNAEGSKDLVTFNLTVKEGPIPLKSLTNLAKSGPNSPIWTNTNSGKALYQFISDSRTLSSVSIMFYVMPAKEGDYGTLELIMGFGSKKLHITVSPNVTTTCNT